MKKDVFPFALSLCSFVEKSYFLTKFLDFTLTFDHDLQFDIAEKYFTSPCFIVTYRDPFSCELRDLAERGPS
jgi:hypothetical protein